MQIADPSFVVATGLHQTIGDCDVKGWDLSGYERRQFLCNKKKHGEYEQHIAYFDFCGKSKDSDWFSVCGKEGAQRHVGAATGIALLGIVTFGYLFSGVELDLRGGQGLRLKKVVVNVKDKRD